MVIDQNELKEKSKSSFGKYQPQPENPLAKKFYEIFLKRSSGKSFWQGAISAAVIVYWFMSKNALPLYIWFGYIFLLNIGTMVYWHFEKKRLDLEILRTETELKEIQKEIKERKEYFSKVNEELKEEDKKNQQEN